MATSKLPEKWIAGAFVYSGRRDPTWDLSEKVANRLIKLWDLMPASSEPAPTASGLGYRGVFLRGPEDREWWAFHGIASLKTPAAVDVRIDAGREFEKTLLASAPDGLLPDANLKG